MRVSREQWLGGVDVRRPEELLQHDVHAAEHLSQEEVVAGLVKDAVLPLVVAQRPRGAEVGGWCAVGGGILS